MKFRFLLLGLLFIPIQGNTEEKMPRLDLSGTYDDNGGTPLDKVELRERKINEIVDVYNGKPIPLWCDDQKDRLQEAQRLVPATDDPVVTERSREQQKKDLANVVGEGEACAQMRKAVNSEKK